MFAEQFTNPVIVFEDMSGIRGEIKYGSYMNRRLHKLPFHKFETFLVQGDVAGDSHGYGGCLLQLEDVFVLW